MDKEPRLQTTILTFLAIVLLATITQQVAWTFTMPGPKNTVPVACVGTALTVTYPFQGGYIDDHACKPQCADGKQRYILYSNGKATQCGVPPDCNDVGEDQGMTCIPPGGSSAL